MDDPKLPILATVEALRSVGLKARSARCVSITTIRVQNFSTFPHWNSVPFLLPQPLVSNWDLRSVGLYSCPL